MRVLLSFENLAGFGGTETYALTVAQQLDALGHEVGIYSPNHGEAAELARRRGLRVLGTGELPRGCDLVVFNDTATCHELAPRYSGAVRLFVAHSNLFGLQAPPRLASCVDAVIVLNDRIRRTVEARGWHAPIVRLRQPIDTTRYRDLGPPRAQARVVLVLTNYVAGARAQLIEQACDACGLEVRWVGLTSAASPEPEHAIADADIVIGLGRSALEGMAGGRTVYVYGAVGGDGWVTAERYPQLEADGFAGLADRTCSLDVASMVDELRDWSWELGERNRDLVFAHHEAREHAIELVALAHEPSQDSPPAAEACTVGEELAYLVRREHAAHTRATGALAEASRLRGLVDERDRRVTGLETELGRVRSELESRLASAEAAREQLGARAATAEVELGHARAELAGLSADAGRLSAEVDRLSAEAADRTARTAGLEVEATDLRVEAADLRVEATDLRAELGRLRATRRYRLACRLAKPLDQLRAALRP